MDGPRSMSVGGRRQMVLTISAQRGTAAAMLGLLTAVGLIVVSRRLAGALDTPLEPTALLLTGVLAAIVGVAVRLAGLSSASTSAAPWLGHTMMIVASLAIAALGGGLCVPGTPVFGKFLFVVILGGEESWAWAWYLRRHSPSVPSHPLPLVPRPAPLVSDVSLDATVCPEGVTQQFTRSQAADGTEEISGWLRSAFTAGQRTGSIHVAFCPPFAVTPELAVEQIDGPEARVKTAQLLPYGARVDLKLTAAAEGPTDVVLQFAARSAPKSQS